MYGIVIDDHTDPYIYADELGWMIPLVQANQRTGHRARLVAEVSECEHCGRDLPGGWVEVDEYGDYLEPQVHDSCRPPYFDQARAGIYV